MEENGAPLAHTNPTEALSEKVIPAELYVVIRDVVGTGIRPSDVHRVTVKVKAFQGKCFELLDVHLFFL